MRYVLYAASFFLAGLLIAVCCTYFFDQELWQAGWKWAEDQGLSPAGCLYISYAVFFLTAIMHFWCRYEKAKFLARVQDRNYVCSLVASGEQELEYLSDDPESAADKETRDEQENPSDKAQTAKDNENTCNTKERLRKVIKKLKDKLDDNEAIVEYDLLALKTLLVDCAGENAAPAQARIYLTDLKNLADEEAHTQTVEEYLSIRHRVEDAEREIYAQRYRNEEKSGCDGSEEKEVPAVSRLRAIVQEELLPTLTESEKLWSEGSAIVKILRGACLAVIPLLLAAGLIPMYMDDTNTLWGIHWAILGVAGALVAVLRALGKTARLVVGNEQGVKEVQRAWWGAGLGLVAGLLTYMLVKSGFVACFLFGGPCLPDNPESQRITYVHMLLAFVAGFAFERAIDRVRAAAGS